MKNYGLIVLLVGLISGNVIAQQPNFEWAKQFGNAAPTDIGNAVTTDLSGNVYTIGNFSGTVDFDPGINVYNLSSPNSTTFISKLDVNGNFVWAKYFEIPNNFGYSVGNDIKLDPLGNIYITGAFNGNIDAFFTPPQTQPLPISGGE